MTEKEYRAYPAISRSELWKMSESPEKFQWYRTHPTEPTESLLFGQVVHKLVLEPHAFEDEFLVMPTLNLRTKQGKAERDEWLQMAEGRTLITEQDFFKATNMANKVHEIPYMRSLLENPNALTEHPFFWTDGLTGEECKCRTDLYDPEQNIIIDYKTTTSADARQFNRSLFRFGYHLQAAMYSEGVMTALGITERPTFVFVAQEKTEPYSVNIIRVTDDVMTYGVDMYRELLGTYHACKELDVWPGYMGFDNEMAETVLPGWVDTVESEESE